MTIRYICNGKGCTNTEEPSRVSGALPPKWTVRFVDEPEGRKALHYCTDCQDEHHKVKASALGSEPPPGPPKKAAKPKPRKPSKPREATVQRSKPKPGDDAPPSLF